MNGVITNLIGQNQASDLQDTVNKNQDVQQQLKTYGYILTDPDASTQLKKIAQENIFGLVSKHGGKQGKDMLPQLGDYLTQFAALGTLQQRAARANLGTDLGTATSSGFIPPVPAPAGTPSQPDVVPPPGIRWRMGPGGTITPVPDVPTDRAQWPNAPQVAQVSGMGQPPAQQPSWAPPAAAPAAAPPHVSRWNRIANALGAFGAGMEGYSVWAERNRAQQQVQAQKNYLDLVRQQLLQLPGITQEQYTDTMLSAISGFRQPAAARTMGPPGKAGQMVWAFNAANSSDPATRTIGKAYWEELNRAPLGYVTMQESKQAGSEIAGAIMRGEQPPDLTNLGRGGVAGYAREELARMHYDLTKATMDWRAMQRAVATMNGPQMLGLQSAIRFTADALNAIDDPQDQKNDLIGQLKAALPASKGISPILNRAVMELAAQGAYGPDAQSKAQQLQSQIADMQFEMAVVYMKGNSPTDQGIYKASAQLQSQWSEQTLRDSVQLARENLLRRQNSISHMMPMVPQMMGGAGAYRNIYGQLAGGDQGAFPGLGAGGVGATAQIPGLQPVPQPGAIPPAAAGAGAAGTGPFPNLGPNGVVPNPQIPGLAPVAPPAPGGVTPPPAQGGITPPAAPPPPPGTQMGERRYDNYGLPIAPTPGTAASDDILDRFLKRFNNDWQKAHQQMLDDGWADR